MHVLFVSKIITFLNNKLDFVRWFIIQTYRKFGMFETNWCTITLQNSSLQCYCSIYSFVGQLLQSARSRSLFDAGFGVLHISYVHLKIYGKIYRKKNTEKFFCIFSVNFSVFFSIFFPNSNKKLNQPILLNIWATYGSNIETNSRSRLPEPRFSILKKIQKKIRKNLQKNLQKKKIQKNFSVIFSVIFSAFFSIFLDGRNYCLAWFDK